MLAILLGRASRAAKRERAALHEEFRRTISDQAENSHVAQGRQLDLLEKAFAQLRATNAWEYQSIMSMSGAPAYDVSYDPSPEAEADRIAERDSTKDTLDDNLNAEESAALADLFPGLG